MVVMKTMVILDNRVCAGFSFADWMLITEPEAEWIVMQHTHWYTIRSKFVHISHSMVAIGRRRMDVMRALHGNSARMTYRDTLIHNNI